MPTQPLYLPFKELYLQLHKTDQCTSGCNTFHTLHEFREFLLENPKILEALKTGNLDTGIIIDKNQDMDLENRI